MLFESIRLTPSTLPGRKKLLLERRPASAYRAAPPPCRAASKGAPGCSSEPRLTLIGAPRFDCVTENVIFLKHVACPPPPAMPSCRHNAVQVRAKAVGSVLLLDRATGVGRREERTPALLVILTGRGILLEKAYEAGRLAVESGLSRPRCGRRRCARARSYPGTVRGLRAERDGGLAGDVQTPELVDRVTSRLRALARAFRSIRGRVFVAFAALPLFCLACWVLAMLNRP